MAEMNFDGGVTKQRSMLIPVLLALLALAAIGIWFSKTYLQPSVTGKVDKAMVYPVHTEYKAPHGSGTVVAADQTEDDVYVITQVMLDNHSDVPLFFSGFHGRVTMDDGSEMDANVIDKNDLARLMLMFPALKQQADAIGSTPLLREGSVAKNAKGSGYFVMSYSIPQSMWDKRKSAEISIDFYHQDQLTLPIPK